MNAETEKKKVEHVSVRDANQGFSQLISRVERGARFIVTKNKRAVARIEPVDGDDRSAEARRTAASERLERLMESGRRSSDGWTFGGKRDDLHDRSV